MRQYADVMDSLGDTAYDPRTHVRLGKETVANVGLHPWASEAAKSADDNGTAWHRSRLATSLACIRARTCRGTRRALAG